MIRYELFINLALQNMDTKLLGGILLITGTTIGAPGMLALPLTISQTGFIYSSLLIFCCWFLMTASALLLLEVNLWLESNSNIISMAKKTLGSAGEIIAWITNLLLLYSLIAAYIAGGDDLLAYLLAMVGIKIPDWLSSIIYTGLLGFIVYKGIYTIDLFNRGLTISKFGAYLLLVCLVLPFITPHHLLAGEFKHMTLSAPIAITAFAFAIIIPSLRTYFHGNVNKLRRVILIGSSITLACYILWDLVILGTIPRTGDHGLIAISYSTHPASNFVNTLSSLVNRTIITDIAHIFTGLCLATSFLGVSLSLSDFLADGLRIEKKAAGNLLICLLTFLPPLVLVLFYPGIFIKGLNYAGIDCIILLVLLPVCMVWRGRYGLKIASNYQVTGGKPLLVLLSILGVFFILESVLQ